MVYIRIKTCFLKRRLPYFIEFGIWNLASLHFAFFTFMPLDLSISDGGRWDFALRAHHYMLRAETDRKLPDDEDARRCAFALRRDHAGNCGATIGR